MTQPVIKSKGALPIHDRIREAREASDYTVESLARKLNVSSRTVAGWQSGRSRPSYERLVELAALLQQPPSYFLGDGEAVA